MGYSKAELLEKTLSRLFRGRRKRKFAEYEGRLQKLLEDNDETNDPSDALKALFRQAKEDEAAIPGAGWKTIKRNIEGRQKVGFLPYQQVPNAPGEYIDPLTGEVRGDPTVRDRILKHEAASEDAGYGRRLKYDLSKSGIDVDQYKAEADYGLGIDQTLADYKEGIADRARLADQQNRLHELLTQHEYKEEFAESEDNRKRGIIDYEAKTEAEQKQRTADAERLSTLNKSLRQDQFNFNEVLELTEMLGEGKLKTGRFQGPVGSLLGLEGIQRLRRIMQYDTRNLLRETFAETRPTNEDVQLVNEIVANPNVTEEFNIALLRLKAVELVDKESERMKLSGYSEDEIDQMRVSASDALGISMSDDAILTDLQFVRGIWNREKAIWKEQGKYDNPTYLDDGDADTLEVYDNELLKYLD